MEVIATPTALSILIALIFALFAYSIYVPRNNDIWMPEIDSEGEDTKLLKVLSMIGSELYATLPQGVKVSQKRNPKLELLLVRSGNPWNISPDEFIFFQFVTGFIGFIAGWGVWALLSTVTSIPLWAILILTTVFGFLVPRLKYSDQAKKRDLEFKRQLPEALDLIIISLSGGQTFIQAVKDSIPNMQDGVLKTEFKEIVNGVDTGKTLDEALEHFGERAPNESIKTFIQAVREATELDVPLIDVLESRSEASRDEFFALIHNRTAVLPSKMMVVLTSTLIPALMIIVLAPALMSLTTLL